MVAPVVTVDQTKDSLHWST